MGKFFSSVGRADVSGLTNLFSEMGRFGLSKKESVRADRRLDIAEDINLRAETTHKTDLETKKLALSEATRKADIQKQTDARLDADVTMDAAFSLSNMAIGAPNTATAYRNWVIEKGGADPQYDSNGNITHYMTTERRKHTLNSQEAITFHGFMNQGVAELQAGLKNIQAKIQSGEIKKPEVGQKLMADYKGWIEKYSAGASDLKQKILAQESLGAEARKTAIVSAAASPTSLNNQTNNAEDQLKSLINQYSPAFGGSIQVLGGQDFFEALEKNPGKIQEIMAKLQPKASDTKTEAQKKANDLIRWQNAQNIIDAALGLQPLDATQPSAGTSLADFDAEVTGR